MKRAILIVKAMNIEGRHLYNCFASHEVRQRGWRLMQRANRIARKLKVEGVV